MRLPALALTCLICAVPAAHGQAGPGNAELVGATESLDFERDTDGAARRAELARDESIREARRRTSRARARPAKPAEVKPGSEVRGTKGAVLGVVESASMTAAVVSSAGGTVEVPIDSFGIDAKGLLLAVTKEDFDALVAQARRPAP